MALVAVGEHDGVSHSARRAVKIDGGSAHVSVCQYRGAYAAGATQFPVGRYVRPMAPPWHDWP